MLFDFLSATRKAGERVYASEEKSYCKKEDRKKEEISFPLQVHTHFWLGKIFSSLFLVFSCCGLTHYETPFLIKFQDNFVTRCKITININNSLFDVCWMFALGYLFVNETNAVFR